MPYTTNGKPDLASVSYCPVCSFKTQSLGLAPTDLNYCPKCSCNLRAVALALAFEAGERQPLTPPQPEKVAEPVVRVTRPYNMNGARAHNRRVGAAALLLGAARKKKRHRTKITPEMVARMNELFAEGKNYRQIAAALGVYDSTVQRHVTRAAKEVAA